MRKLPNAKTAPHRLPVLWLLSGEEGLGYGEKDGKKTEEGKSARGDTEVVIKYKVIKFVKF
ncbi:hypothetical protein A3G06_02670 [Candidatus Nomurabacteria bacterium RIFCSPLOWO2_12_FULL_46_14]|uniref:Uncharacterized protein n=1 Tax=Candidatus Nomurabacteria bacterium RIFCSPLOWO2_12_FULL_46_14 TaxID=1801797 RepID=A0A1F6YAU6_9BACT|nr:MAG: hypothetical protein A3G06_02670 [Candidatus Nomurabacteria bacterium RIFCSPLOWO2_12_FULL_46_14]